MREGREEEEKGERLIASASVSKVFCSGFSTVFILLYAIDYGPCVVRVGTSNLCMMRPAQAPIISPFDMLCVVL